jgi:hypothetical protein
VQSLGIEELLLESPSCPKNCLLALLMIRVIKPPGLGVRTDGSLLPPHTTDTTLKSLSPKVFLENVQIPEFSNPSKYSS